MLSQAHSAAAISERVKDIANAINKRYEHEKMLHIIITLNGAFMFGADLIRLLNVPVEVHFAGTGSYSGREKKDLRIDPDALPKSFGNTPVIILEDIMDSGATIGHLRDILARRFASEIKVATLLRRQSGTADADWYGFTVPKGLFVVGYGMDMNGRYRELPDLNVVGIATGSGLC